MEEGLDLTKRGFGDGEVNGFVKRDCDSLKECVVVRGDNELETPHRSQALPLNQSLGHSQNSYESQLSNQNQLSSQNQLPNQSQVPVPTQGPGERNFRQKGSEWRNELLSFPQLFNQVFLSLYRFNDYIDQRWLALDESHGRLYELLLELSEASHESCNQSRANNIIILGKQVQCISKGYIGYQNINKQLCYHVVEVNIAGIAFFDSSSASNGSHDLKAQLYSELFNRYLTCKNDIEITFERKVELISELNMRIRKIAASIERFVETNREKLESHFKPLYNIDNREISEIGVVRRKTGQRGRPPGSGNRGRPPGSTKKAKMAQSH
ncbi:hypothetical protein HWI79_2054 [Cryptosporidium felis]|nr:hypothetical protein HWI79_2054 [Cryptosporidium felis]